MFEVNKEIEQARDFLQFTGVNIFLTGKAGTGKTTFLRNMVEELNKQLIVAAPTGVAALNARGVTLHSIFQLPLIPFIPSEEKISFSNSGNNFKFRKINKNKLALIRSLELLIIDEISMVRCDLLDAVDDTLRTVRGDERPFGGVQLLMIGDIQQLSPVCKEADWQLLSKYYPTPYFFDSIALKKCNYVTVELKKIYRQRDKDFTDLLNAIGANKITQKVFDKLNQRYIPNFEHTSDQGYITLTTHNARANYINENKLTELDGDKQVYVAELSGDFPEYTYPNETSLLLKVGAQVMFLKNDITPEKLYYNGMIGEIVELKEASVVVKPKSGGENIDVRPMAWENIEYLIDGDSGEINENIKGSFTQIPLKCAWAITIHKSQGLTFDRAIIDAGSSFAHGQVYVALSRLSNFEGLVLSSPLSFRSVVKDQSVEKFTTYFKDNIVTDNEFLLYKKLYFGDILCEIFSFKNLLLKILSLSKYFNGYLFKEHPSICENLIESMNIVDNDIFKVGEKFKIQIKRLVMECRDDYNNNQYLNERLAKGSQYFSEKLAEVKRVITEVGKVHPDAKDIKKRVDKYYQDLTEIFKMKEMGITLTCEGFSIEEYQQRKKIVLVGDIKGKNSRSGNVISKTASNKENSGDNKEKLRLIVSDDIVNKELYEILYEWRDKKAKKLEQQHFTIMANRSIIEIQALLPPTIKELKKISGLGKSKIKNFGDEIIEIINNFAANNLIDIDQYYKEAISKCEVVDGSLKINENIIAKQLSNDNLLGDTFIDNSNDKVKEKTLPSHIVTLSLYYDGHDLTTISKIRALNLDTIYTHIAKNIRSGELTIEEFVDIVRIEKIREAINSSEGGLKEVKNILGDEYSYAEIRLVIANDDETYKI